MPNIADLEYGVIFYPILEDEWPAVVRSARLVDVCPHDFIADSEHSKPIMLQLGD